jgi:hypothetical protein
MQRAMELIFIRVDLLFSSSAGRAHARPGQTSTSSSTDSVDLPLLDAPMRSQPPTLAVHGLALVWPRSSAAVAGRATVPP